MVKSCRYRLWLRQPEVLPTNNATEQAIGQLKMRARTVRDLKAFAGAESALLSAHESPDGPDPAVSKPAPGLKISLHRFWDRAPHA